jgi:hypothetical protein
MSARVEVGRWSVCAMTIGYSHCWVITWGLPKPSVAVCSHHACRTSSQGPLDHLSLLALPMWGTCGIRLVDE